MVKIKNRPLSQRDLDSEELEEVKKQIAEIVNEKGRVTSKEFPSKYWQKKGVRSVLFRSQNAKCCFCENKRAPKREFDAEHFRPKAGVTEDEDHPGYWWLAYEWSNLLYACKSCNQEFKKNYFPLLSNNRAMSPEDDLQNEVPVIINPISESPEDFIGFDWQQAYGVFVKAIGLDDQNRGNDTIKIVGLNRDDLLGERAEFTVMLEQTVNAMKVALTLNNQEVLNDMKKKIKDLTSSQRRFTGFRRAFFRAAGLGRYVEND